MSSKNRKGRAKKRSRSQGEAIRSKVQARMAALDPRIKITYFIPHPTQDLHEASPFGFYTPGLQRSDGMLMSACTLPADIREPFTDRGTVLQFRLLRMVWPQVVPIGIRSLQALAAHGLHSLFRVMLTNDAALADTIDVLRFRDGVPFLHASAIAGPNRISPEALHADGLLTFVDSVLVHLEKTPELRDFVEWMREAMPPSGRRRDVTLAMGSSAHNVTLPNESALRAFGWVFRHQDPLVPDGRNPPEPKDYVQRICSLSDLVNEKRSELMKKRMLPPSLGDWAHIVTVPSIHWGHYKLWRERAERMTGSDLKGAETMFEAAVRQTTYFDRLKAPEDTSHTDLEKSAGYRALLASRAADQRCYTAGLSLLASATLTPVLRLEPKINQIRGHLRMLAISVRTRRAGSPQLKQSRLVRDLGGRMRELVDPAFLERIDRYTASDTQLGLKLAAEVPLEWLPVFNLPLMLRYDVSRIPVLPGNLYLQHCVRPPMFVSANQLTSILVVRTFQAEDPLKNVLESAVRGVLSKVAPQTLRVTFKDVETVEQLIAAINEYTGAILVFDGHGAYEDTHGVGTIVVGGRPIEVWDLQEQCQVPPIVIFSACDTHPVDGSHGSSANAAFVLGAETVLGTLLPIDAASAAVFIGRLLLRVAEFIPIALELRTLLTWREVISGMIRMTYVSEVRRTLERQAGILFPHGSHERIQFIANTAISERRINWFEHFVEAMAHELGRSETQIREDIARWASLTDALKYVQLGSPENIVILSDADSQEARRMFAS